MTDRRSSQTLAAEQALGLAAGGDSSAEAARWRGRFAPLFDEVEPVDPPADLWARIALRTGGAADTGNVVVLRRRVNLWRAATGGMTALAASLALVLLQQPNAPPPPIAAAPVERAAAPMVAMLGEGKQMKVVASWDPKSQRLVLAVADDMPADPKHSHELWVIPAGGQPTSMGTMPDSKQMHMELADQLARLLQQGATIAITVEPQGGSPTGKPTGPIVAAGALTSA